MIGTVHPLFKLAMWGVLVFVGWLVVCCYVLLWLAYPSAAWLLGAFMVGFCAGLFLRDGRALDVESAFVRKDTAVDTAFSLAFEAQELEQQLHSGETPAVVPDAEPPVPVFVNEASPPLVGRRCESCGQPANLRLPDGSHWCFRCDGSARALGYDDVTPRHDCDGPLEVLDDGSLWCATCHEFAEAET